MTVKVSSDKVYVKRRTMDEWMVAHGKASGTDCRKEDESALWLNSCVTESYIRVSFISTRTKSLLSLFFTSTMAKDGTKQAVNSNGVPLFKADFTKLDVKLDNEIVYEFGGPLGVIGMVYDNT